MYNPIRKAVVILIWTLATTLSAIYTVGASEPDSFHIEGPREDGRVLISGVSEAGEGKVITIRVQREKQLGQLETVFIDQSTSGVGGAFEFSFTIADDAKNDGVYTFEVWYTGMPKSSQTTQKITVIHAAFEDTLIDAVNDMSESDLINVLEANEFYFKDQGIGNIYWESFTQDQKDSVYASIAGREFTSLEMVSQAISVALAIESLNGASPSEIEEVLEFYPVFAELEIGPGSDFESLTNNQAVIAKITGQNFNLTDVEIVKTTFYNELTLGLLNQINASNKSKLAEHIEKYAEYIGLSPSELEGFKKVSNKSTVINNIITSIPFPTLSASYNTITKAVNEYKEPSTPSSSYGGSGGGGGGGGSSYTSHVLPASDAEKVPAVGGRDGSESATIGSSQIEFSDLDSVSWAADSINKLAARGILNGDGSGKFLPDDMLAREQFVKMLVEVFAIPLLERQSKFSDVNERQWYYPYISIAESIGLVQGISADRFGVGEPVSREDMAVLVMRFANYKSKEFPTVNEPVVFTDQNNISDYASEPVSLLQTAGLLNGMPDGSFCPKDGATRAMAAKLMYSVLEIIGG